MNRIRSLRELPDLDNLQALQDGFWKITGIGIALADSEGKEITRHSGLMGSPFAGAADEKKRRDIYKKLYRETRIQKKPTVTTSPDTGLSTGAAPVFVGMNHLGSWIIGPMLMDAANRDIILRAMLELGMDTGQAKQLLDSLPCLSWERLEQIFEFLQCIVNILLKNAAANAGLRADSDRQPAPVKNPGAPTARRRSSALKDDGKDE